MRWPLVSREAYEERLETNRRLSAILYAERERFDALLEKYSALRLAGANPEPKPAEFTPLPAAETDKLKTLVREVAGNNYSLRAMMLKELAKDRAAGIPDETIAKRITQGVSSEGVPN